MKYFLDTEFIERGAFNPLTLISIGMVAQDGREYYAESLDVKWEHASPWVIENVKPRLYQIPTNSGCGALDLLDNPFISFAANRKLTPVRWRAEILLEVAAFCDPEKYGKPEFIGYYCDYDWVLFAQLFGDMTRLPKGYPMWCYDLKQLCVDLGDPELPSVGKDEHHALADAKWIKRTYWWLQSWKRHQEIGRSVTAQHEAADLEQIEVTPGQEPSTAGWRQLYEDRYTAESESNTPRSDSDDHRVRMVWQDQLGEPFKEKDADADPA